MADFAKVSRFQRRLGLTLVLAFVGTKVPMVPYSCPKRTIALTTAQPSLPEIVCQLAEETWSEEFDGFVPTSQQLRSQNSEI